VVIAKVLGVYRRNHIFWQFLEGYCPLFEQDKISGFFKFLEICWANLEKQSQKAGFRIADPRGNQCLQRGVS
jgi:hypothetical protein